jgi:chemotaxis protein MotB
MRMVVAVALIALTSGCVSQDAFRKKEAEAEQLKARGAELEAALARNEGELKASREKTAELQATVDEMVASKNRLEAKKAELETKSAEYEKMASALRRQIDSGRIELTELRGKMTVKMKDKILFSSGSSTIGREGKEALASVAEVLRGVEGKLIRVEGHTDNVPTGTARSNWDLSTARALSVVRFLQGAGVDPTRLAAAGYGEFQAVAPNDTPEGRSQNRRIEIVLAPADAPPPAASPVPAADAPAK